MMLIRRLGHGLLVALASCAIVRSAFMSQGSTHQSSEYGNMKFIVGEFLAFNIEMPVHCPIIMVVRCLKCGDE